MQSWIKGPLRHQNQAEPEDWLDSSPRPKQPGRLGMGVAINQQLQAYGADLQRENIIL